MADTEAAECDEEFDWVEEKKAHEPPSGETAPEASKPTEDDGAYYNKGETGDDDGQEYEAEDDIDEDEDEIQVTIGDIKPTATFDLSKAAAQRTAAAKAAATQPGAGAGNNAAGAQGGQGKGIDLDAPAFIGNVPVFEYNVDSVADEDKPWRKPGADITDYFNYGFNEDTWRIYCDRQRALRALFGEGQAGMKMLSSNRMGMGVGGGMPRSIPSVVSSNAPHLQLGGGDNDNGGRDSPPTPADDVMMQVPPMMNFSQPPPQFQGKPQPKQPSTISVIGTIGTIDNSRRKQDGQGGAQPQPTASPSAPGAAGSGAATGAGNMPFGFPPFGPFGAAFRSGAGGAAGGNFNAQFAGNAAGGGGGSDFTQPPPRFIGAANPMLAALASGSIRFPTGIMPPNMPGSATSGNNPADLIRLLSSNPALAQQVLALGGARPPLGLVGQPLTLGNMGGMGGMTDDKPGRTPSPRGGSTPSSSPERETVPFSGGRGDDGGSRRRSRSRSPKRGPPQSDDQGGRRIGVLGSSSSGRRDYDRRGGDQWDRGRRGDKDGRDRRDRSPDRRRGGYRDRDDQPRGRRGGDKD